MSVINEMRRRGVDEATIQKIAALGKIERMQGINKRKTEDARDAQDTRSAGGRYVRDNIYVASNALEHLGVGAERGLGAYQEKEYDEEAGRLADEATQGRMAWLQAYMGGSGNPTPGGGPQLSGEPGMGPVMSNPAAPAGATTAGAPQAPMPPIQGRAVAPTAPPAPMAGANLGQGAATPSAPNVNPYEGGMPTGFASPPAQTAPAPPPPVVPALRGRELSGLQGINPGAGGQGGAAALQNWLRQLTGALR